MKTILLEKHCRQTIVGRLKVKCFCYAQNSVGHENHDFLFADCKKRVKAFYNSEISKASSSFYDSRISKACSSFENSTSALLSFRENTHLIHRTPSKQIYLYQLNSLCFKYISNLC